MINTVIAPGKPLLKRKITFAYNITAAKAEYHFMRNIRTKPDKITVQNQTKVYHTRCQED